MYLTTENKIEMSIELLRVHSFYIKVAEMLVYHLVYNRKIVILIIVINT